MGREPLLKRPCGLQPFQDALKWSHSVLIPVSRSYSQLEGRLLTRSSPLRHCALLHRSTCMPNPCRQRSFWARIKLSVQKIFCNRLEFVCAFFSHFKRSWFLNSFQIQIFLIEHRRSLLLRSIPIRAIRTIQFFKEHRIFIRCISNSPHSKPSGATSS